MRSVVIDGVAYVPEGTVPVPLIGVSITTHNRPELLAKAIDAWVRYSPEGTPIVVVDDASEPAAVVPDGVTLVRFDENQGVAKAKNAGIAALYDLGVTHLFLSDDDTHPIVEDWWAPYVQSGEGMLQLSWGDVVYQDQGLVGYTWPKGCMLYLTRPTVDTVGGMDVEFGTWHEHVDLANRTHNAGLTTVRYGDVEGSEKLFHAGDRKGQVKSSIPQSAVTAANPERLLRRQHSTEFAPFRPRHTDTPQTVSLSVLVPSVHTRWDESAHRVQEQLYTQRAALPDPSRVEIIVLQDTMRLPLGEKRNLMVRMASGEYVAFVDDDDRLEGTYLQDLLTGTESGADVITFHLSVSVDGTHPKLCRYSLSYEQDENTATEYRRLPNHIMAVKRNHALRTPFPLKNCGEDFDYAADLRPLLKTEHALNKILYHYDYDRTRTETQLGQRYQHELAEAAKPPVVDVVILSKSETPELRAMTQTAIDTCIAGAGKHRVNVVVIEQVEGVRFRGATTLTETGEFAYNAFANRAIRTGTAPWVMVANSDLVFDAGWLDALLAAKHDLVSPVSMGEIRQKNLTKNEIGDQNGQHFSGWCFMLKRTLWEKIGGLDEDFLYFCADDSVIAACALVGVKPMIVPASRVLHLISQTGGKTAQISEELTWGQVYKFNQKYGQNKFSKDRRYTDYLRRNGLA